MRVLVSSLIIVLLAGVTSCIGEKKPVKQARARHILVSSLEQCEDLKKQLENGADFGELAFRYSLCPSKRKGGDLGTFRQGEMVKEFDEVVFTKELHKVHGPVKTKYGYHLIEISERSE